MAKQYIVSIDTQLPEPQQQSIVAGLENHGLTVVNKILPLGSIVIHANNEESVQQAKQIHGVLAIEEDSSMHTM
jgi:hypothetical protein